MLNETPDTRVFAPSEIQCQEQSRGSVEESVVCPVDGNAVKVAVEVVLCASQCIPDTVAVYNDCFSVDRL